MICEVAGPGARCTIDVQGYENPAGQNVSDANWLSCRAAVRVGSFSAECPAAFSTQDFIEFYRGLCAVLRQAGGTACFQTDEEILSLSLDVKRTGTATISGALRLSGNPGAVLSFTFESDQTFLADTQRQLEALTRAFPERVASNPRGQEPRS